MSSFNINGSFSNLPIRSGDKCYAFLCAYTPNKQGHIQTICSFRVLSLPICCYYDDYISFEEDDIEEPHSSLYNVYLNDLFNKSISEIISLFQNHYHNTITTNVNDKPILFDDEEPFIIIEHQFFIEQIANMTDDVEIKKFYPRIWDENSVFCDDESYDFELYLKFDDAIHKYDIIPHPIYYAGQFDNILKFKKLYQSVVDFLDKDGYREFDKWSN